MFASKDVFLTPPSGGYTIGKSVRLRSSATAYFNRTPASASNRKTWTWSGWVKRSIFGQRQGFFSCQNGAGNASLQFGFLDTDCFQMGNGNVYVLQSSAVYRDPSSWYHCVVAVDTTLASNRCKVYINGSQITSWGTNVFDSTFAQNADTAINNNITHYLGQIGANLSYLDGYLTEVNFIDGQALTPSSFGSTNSITGVWQPAKYTGTYGTNGFYLNFSDNSAVTTSSNVGIGKDFSGNGNYWTSNNINVTAYSGTPPNNVSYDSMTDVPTLTSATAANYCVLNPLNKATPASITNGNLQTTATTVAWQGVWGSLGVSSAKWYFEATVIANDFVAYGMSVGVALDTAPNNASPTNAANAWLYNNSNSGATAGRKLNGATVTNYGATYTTNDIIGVAVDMGAGSLEFYKNGTSQGVAFSSGVSGTIFPYICTYGTDAIALNCGQRPFSYTPPTGYVALNTYNLPAGSITTSGTFTGNASTDGPFVYLNGVPTAMTINGNAVTFGTNADHLANGFKVRSSSASYNASGSNTYTISTTGAKFKNAIAQTNP